MQELLKALLTGELGDFTGDLPVQPVSIHLAHLFRRETAQPDRVVTCPNAGCGSLCGLVSDGSARFGKGWVAVGVGI